MATCHGAGACDTGANATYDTACLQLATGDEQCASHQQRRDAIQRAGLKVATWCWPKDKKAEPTRDAGSCAG